MDKVWDVDFLKVLEEIRNYEVPWHDLGAKKCATNFFIALIMFFVSYFDLYSDIQLANSYIFGSYYMYEFHNNTTGDFFEV